MMATVVERRRGPGAAIGKRMWHAGLAVRQESAHPMKPCHSPCDIVELLARTVAVGVEAAWVVEYLPVTDIGGVEL